MIGKVIGFIIVIVLFLGILYSVGKNQLTTQEQSTQKQSSQEQSSQEQSSQEQSSQQEDNQEQNSQEQSSQQEDNQEQNSQEQSSQENSQVDTGSANDGIASLSGDLVGAYNHDTGEARAYGPMMSDGTKDVKNIIIQITFWREHLKIGEAEIPVGGLAAGEQHYYDEKTFVSLPRYPDNIEVDVKYE